jgi:hypothetical protein
MRTSTSGRWAAWPCRIPLAAALALLLCAGCGTGDQAPGRPAQESKVEGQLDLVDAESISGWVWDRNLPWPPSKLDIYDGETLLATVPANKFRRDLLDAGIGSGQHAFDYPTPAELKDGKSHTIRVKVSGTDVDLPGSPVAGTLKSRLGAGGTIPYADVVKRVREVVRAEVPSGATVLVASAGDDELLKFDGRTGRHFPEASGGAFDGNPADSKDAVARLEALRAKGGQYLLLPEPVFWWLEHYKEFRQHLDERYPRVHADDYCVIYRLAEQPMDK